MAVSLLLADPAIRTPLEPLMYQDNCFEVYVQTVTSSLPLRDTNPVTDRTQALNGGCCQCCCQNKQLSLQAMCVFVGDQVSEG